MWDYPRPPRIERCTKHVRVLFEGKAIAESDRAFRVLETSSPPTIYLPPDDVSLALLEPVDDHNSYCEWKGGAVYFDVVVAGERAKNAVWSYPDPKPAFAVIKDYVSFYPAKVECFLDDEPVQPQEGGFYGGWITKEIVGPFKGARGTGGW